MIVGVLGDIHGNSLALKAVLDEIRNYKIKYLLITGDIVGYYYHPDRVFEELDAWPYEIVQGNHDRLLGEIYHGKTNWRKIYRKKYGSGIECALDTLSPEQCEYLAKLPPKKEIMINNKKILLCHGSPFDQDEYIYPDSPGEIFLRLSDLGYDVIIMGHTHYPLKKRINSTTILNPGSLGQTRNYVPGAHWALLDLDTLDVQLKHTVYDVRSVVVEAQRRDPDIPYLAQVLVRKSKYMG